MNFPLTKGLRVIVLCHEDLVPPDSVDGLTIEQIQPYQTEYDVVSTLRRMGHDVRPVGLYSDLGVITTIIQDFRPHIAFNLLEEFHGLAVYDQHVVSFLELSKLPYTGCNPRGLTLAHDKALSKKILSFHRINVPRFGVFPMNRKVRRPKLLNFPLLIKSISEDGSAGISQASVVYDDDKLAERVSFIHRQVNTHAIAEQYIEGREIYVAVLGNQRLQTYSPWELLIRKLAEGAPNIATGKVKWDYKYQTKVGVETSAANLPPELNREIAHLSKRIYRILNLSGYARLDYRVMNDGRIYLLEANPNPNLSFGEDFAEAARDTGIEYEPLLQKIMTLGLSYRTVL